jgi:curved DNA-binding protein CbpA
MQPLILGPTATSSDEGLWHTSQAAPLEAALGDVNADQAPTGASIDAVPPEPMVEAEFETTGFAPFPGEGDNAAQSVDTRGTADADEDLLDGDWPDDEDSVGSDPEAAKLRRQRLLRRAMENMGTIAPRISGAVPESPEQPAEPAEPAADPNKPSPEEQQLAEQIEKRHTELKDKPDHFKILGLGRDANKDQVKSAFLNLAKSFHPDRLPPSLHDLSAKMTTVFEAIREAYDVLYEDSKRTAYLATLNRAAAQAAKKDRDPVAEALEDFREGEAHFKRRAFVQAEEAYQRAHAADAKPLYLAAAAWAIYMDPDRKAEAARAKQMMLDAVKADAKCDRAHYQLGIIAKVEGELDRSEKHFREAVRANPKHAEANQELRLIEMRKKKDTKKGFFG